MKEEISQPQFVSLMEAVKLLPQSQGRPFSSNTVWRWARKGIKSRMGDRIYLQHVRFGGKLFTTKPWLDEFGLKLAETDKQYFEARQESYFQPSWVSPNRKHKYSKQRLAQIEQAERELRELGI